MGRRYPAETFGVKRDEIARRDGPVSDSATAALVKGVNPNYNANRVRKTLRNAANRVGDRAYHGKGHLDTNAAVRE